MKTDLTVHDFMYREQEVVRALREVVRQNIERHRMDLIQGTATFEDDHTMAVAPTDADFVRRIRGDVILIATGSVPARPKDIPFEDPRVHDSDEILEMQGLPRTMAVVGAGVIGCEYTTIFAALGIRVTLLDGRDRLLAFLDAEIAERLRLQMESLGVDLRLGDGVRRVTPQPEAVHVDTKRGDLLAMDAVLFAAGRYGATQGLGLEKVGLSVNDRGLLAVNEHYQTAVPHIYAAGDVVGFPAPAGASM